MTVGSPAEVWQTSHLAHSVYFLLLRPSEVWQTDQSGQSDAFLLQGESIGLGPDWDQTSSRIWSSPIDSIGSLMDCLAESVGIG